MKISICIIAKNEEQYLPRLLDSIGSECDVVVLDTGSTDKTVEIAKKFGANVQHFKWTNSFADARNAAASYAKHDWIMWLDADMWLPAGELKKAEDLIDRMPNQIDSITFKVIDSSCTFQSPRVYKKGLQFAGNVHEDFRPKNSITTPFIIYHQRDEKPEDRKIKDAVYEKMLLDEYQNDNKSLHALMYLRDLAMYRQDYKKAKLYCHQFLEIEDDYICNYYLSTIHYEEKNYKEALDCAFKALQSNGKDPRVYGAIANIYDEIGQKIDALTFYHLSMNLPPESRLVNTKYAIQDDCYSVIPLCNIAKIYLDVGDKEKAMRCYQQALQINPNTIHRSLIEQNMSKI